jgi:hypothetical protein
VQLIQGDNHIAGTAAEKTERNEIMTKASKLQIQLMEVLEQSGRSLVAQQVSEKIRQNLLKRCK